jgi:Mg-chelatase subunit ChlD
MNRFRSTVECYDCHQQVSDLKAHRGVCRRGRHGKSGTVECYDCRQQVTSLHDHRALGQCSNPGAGKNGYRQVHVVAPVPVPVAVALPGRDHYVLVDLSGSMGGAKLEQAKAALTEVHARVPDEDRLAIISFDSAAFFKLKPRANGQVRRQNELPDLLARMRAQGSTALYDAIFLAVEQIRDKQRETRIVVLTDGEDNASRHTLAEVLALVDQHAAVTLDIVHIDGQQAPSQAFAQLAQRGRGVYEKVTVETIVRVTVERVLAAGGHDAMDVTA